MSDTSPTAEQRVKEIDRDSQTVLRMIGLIVTMPSDVTHTHAPVDDLKAFARAWTAQCEEVARLTTALADAQRDAERWRVLRRNSVVISERPMGEVNPVYFLQSDSIPVRPKGMTREAFVDLLARAISVPSSTDSEAK